MTAPTIAIVPMRHSSERVKGKNYRPLGGRPLFHHIVDTLLSVDCIDRVVIDTDSEVIAQSVAAHYPDVLLLERPEHLRAGGIAMNDVLANSLEQIEADVVLQTHSTNPFLSRETVRTALDRFNAKRGEADSLFAVTRLQARLWDRNVRPVNHDPAVLMRTQDLDPLFLENSCFYIFTKSLLLETHNRIGRHPAIFEMPALEAIDIDEESDFDLAVAIESTREL
jgi:CMP-N-acetylneuraminic acid synthetase